MKKEFFTSLGLMSGTSMDGVDISLIKSDGYDEYISILDDYYEFNYELRQNLINLRDKIFTLEDLKKNSLELADFERKFTLFIGQIVKKIQKNYDKKIDLIGFHGQTIFHNPEQKISKQVGDGELLSQVLGKTVINDFRQQDILNGGQGAPLTPVFHHLISMKNEIRLPVCFLNIGGISNITIVKEKKNLSELISKDIGPGNCLIDNWVRKNSNKKFDQDGILASTGTKNEIIFEQAQELYANRNSKKKKSFDVNDFDISFVRGLNLQDGVATLTDFTASTIAEELSLSLKEFKKNPLDVLICGGGRKNKLLLKKIEENISLNINLKLIDDYNINGDFIESQAFAFLAVRSFQGLPISYPNTTGCKKPCLGGELIKN